MTDTRKAEDVQGVRSVRMGPVRVLAALVAVVVSTSACGESGEDAARTTTAPTSSTAPATPSAEVSLDERVAVDAEGREVAVRCWGEGSPTILLETGHPGSGIDDLDGAAFTEELATKGTVCTYDRLGEGASDQPPDQLRTADDVVDVLHAVIVEAALETPLVLVGASFGGMIVTHHAATYPDDAAAVVLLDVPAPVAGLDFPELVWDHPGNTERLDIVDGFEGRFAEAKAPIGVPLLVITAQGGETDVEDQSVWLEISDDATQVAVAGGHDVAADNPGEVAAEIEAFLATR